MYEEIKRVNTYCDGPGLCVFRFSLGNATLSHNREREESVSLPHEQARFAFTHLPSTLHFVHPLASLSSLLNPKTRLQK